MAPPQPSRSDPKSVHPTWSSGHTMVLIHSFGSTFITARISLLAVHSSSSLPLGSPASPSHQTSCTCETGRPEVCLDDQRPRPLQAQKLDEPGRDEHRKCLDAPRDRVHRLAVVDVLLDALDVAQGLLVSLAGAVVGPSRRRQMAGAASARPRSCAASPGRSG